MRSVQIDGVALPAIEFLYSLVACDNDRGTKNGQLSLPLQPGRQLLAILSAKMSQILPGAFSRTINSGGIRKSVSNIMPPSVKARVKSRKLNPDCHHHNHHKSAHQRRDNAQIKMIERINIRHHAIEQFALTIARQSGRGEGAIC